VDTDTIDTFLLQAGKIIGAGPFSAHLAAVAEAWAMDKAALAAPSVAETQAALLGAGQLRIREAVAVVRAAAARSGPIT
jgi:hypothetical protein